MTRFFKSPIAKGCWPYCVIIVYGLGLVILENDYLRRVEELNLFLHTPLFFSQCMVVPGGMLSWIGAFLTQLLAMPTLGVAVICVLWCLLVAMMRRVYHIPSGWEVLTLVPVTMLMAANVCLGYWVFFIKLRGFFFVPTLGLMAVVALTGVFRCLPPTLRVFFAPLSVAFSYLLLGGYALLAALSMCLTCLHLRDNSKSLACLCLVLTVVTGIVAPLLAYGYVYHQINLAYIYSAAFPLFSMRETHYFLYDIPYVVMALSLLFMAAGLCHVRQTAKRPQGWIQVGGMAVLLAVLAAFWYRDANFHHELAMRNCVDKLDWEGVLGIARDVRAEPTRDMWMMKNLALARLGRQGKEMYDYPNGASKANVPFETRMVHWDGKALYLQYGLPNYCFRWCMEDGVKHGFGVEDLKLMTKCALVNGELESALKYLGLLKKTLFHKKWALKYENYVHNPNLIEQDEELIPVLHMLGEDNYLSGDNSQIERFMIEHFAGTESEDPLLQEQALLAAMQLRNPDVFWLRFYQYTELHKSQQVPELYQQAACLFGGMDKRVDASHMPFDKEVVQSCREFMDSFKQYRDQGFDMDRIREMMRSRFHATYYFDYFFNRYQEEAY